MSIRLRATLAMVLAVGLLGDIRASDAPDAEVNPVTGKIESVGEELVGSDFDLRHTVDPGQGAPAETTLLTSAVANDRRPRIAITPTGQAWVAWWRDGSTDAVLVRKRDTAGAWQTERVASLPGQNSYHPEIVYSSGHPWVAYEFDTTGGTGIAAVAIDDTPDPFGRVTLATSTVAGDPSVQIHAEPAHLWVTWIQDATTMGWSELDPVSQTWLPVAFEAYDAATGVAGARSRIRIQVLAP